MNITIDLLDFGSIIEAKLKLEEYIKSLPRRCEELARKLSEYGADRAKAMFDSAVYDLDMDGETRGKPDIAVTVSDPQTTESGVVYTINADGRDVCFVEFGAGVFYNSGGDPYHDTRPEGIVGIGEYGKGKGKREFWVFNAPEYRYRLSRSGKGMTRMLNENYMTRGTPEQPGMYLASKAMKDVLWDLAREVFGHD